MTDNKKIVCTFRRSISLNFGLVETRFNERLLILIVNVTEIHMNKEVSGTTVRKKKSRLEKLKLQVPIN